MEKSISFRADLLSNTLDLLKEIDIECARTANLVVAVASALAAYTEEGSPLTPSVFICNSISDLVKRSGVGEFVPLSRPISMENAATSILKAAAPVCSRTWNVYVERSHDGKTCQFGVFCGSFDPSSLNIDEVVLSGYDGFPVVRIAQSSNNKVEVRNNAGSAIEFRFNADSDIQELGHRARITELASIIASGHTDTAPAFAGFVERALAQAIRESHGTLIAVLPGDVSALPELLSDATMLQPAVDLFDRHSAHIQEGKTALSVGRLQAASELVAGFIRCDGITVFNCHGQILGYRAFVNAPAPANPSGGGARTRAFVALGKYVGNGLQAAYFRSQDGKTDLIKK